MITMKYKELTFWLILYILLTVFLQYYFQYHFFYIEQSQLFLFTHAYLFEQISEPGGLSLFIAEFLVQFFIYPYVGPAVISALLIGTGIVTKCILNRIVPDNGCYLFSLLPAVALLFMHFGFNYRVQGTVAYLIMLVCLNIYIRISHRTGRLILGVFLVLLLSLTAGSIALLFSVSAFCYEWIRRERYWWLSSVLFAESLFLGLLFVFFSMVGEYRFAFLPDLYYHDYLTPSFIIYAAWIILPVLMLFVYLQNKIQVTNKRLVKGAYIAQFVILLALLMWGIPKYGDFKSLRIKSLDYFARTEQWDEIIASSKGKITNLLYLSHLNMALANKGMLADRMFFFDQKNPQGLLVSWNKSENISCLLSDIYYTMGFISLSQQMAFEAYVSAMENGNPRMLKRLVQTNLIQGEYAVAEKYINVLEKTITYKDWAVKQRRFLYNDEVVQSDAELGSKRRLLPAQKGLALADGLAADLHQLIRTNPNDQTAIHYLGCFLLLSKDLDGFKKMLETYYGTEVLPQLPLHFQEAVFVLSEKDSEYWKQYAIAPDVIQRFSDYKKTVLGNRNNNALQGLLARSFGNSYWYYFMFK